MFIRMNLNDFKKFIEDAEKSSFEYSNRVQNLVIRIDNFDIDIVNEDREIVANINADTKKTSIYG
ncbi:MAG: hypothetical protein ACRCX2_36925 [Paraclostridium sp.]